MGEIEEICDKVAILCNEKIIEQGDPSKIKKKYNSKEMEKVFEKIFANKRKKAYQEHSEIKTKLKEKNNKTKKEDPWGILEQKIKENKKSGKYKNDF